MAQIRSNLGEVSRSLRDVSSCLNMHAVGRYDRVGVDALDIIAEGIAERVLGRQQEPSGGGLAELAPSTRRRKRELGQPDTIGVAKREMLQQRHLRGERNITTTQASVEYGQDAAAKDKATWFSEGSRRKRRRQPPRPFFELDDQIEDSLDELVEEVVDRAIERNGG